MLLISIENSSEKNRLLGFAVEEFGENTLLQ